MALVRVLILFQHEKELIYNLNISNSVLYNKHAVIYVPQLYNYKNIIEYEKNKQLYFLKMFFSPKTKNYNVINPRKTFKENSLKFLNFVGTYLSFRKVIYFFDVVGKLF